MEFNPALLALSGVIVAAALTAFGAILSVQAKRIDELESSTRRAHEYNRKLWMYVRTLIDMYYKHRKDGSPDPPPLPEEDN